jgi:hypothetical protein
MKTAVLILAATYTLSAVASAPHDFASPPKPAKPPTATSISAPKCQVTTASHIIIECTYTAGASADANRRTASRIILNRAVISLMPSDDSLMRVALTFTNGTATKIADARTVYLSIDDVKGENHMRRPLPHVDFTKLEPGRRMQFEETLQAPAFSAGQYVISIWIPSTDPALKFDPAHNLLLSSQGVPDLSTGLNHIAKFAVLASSESKPKSRQTVPN